jgi:hypothetical protein
VFASTMVLQRAMLDGYQGFLFASMSFQHELVAHAKIQDVKRMKRMYPDKWKDTWLETECQRW